MFRPRLLFLAAAVAAIPAAAAPRVAEPAAGARLPAGASAVALLDLSGVPLDGVEEMELVLSLDGGRTFPLCVSRDLAPGVSRAVWSPPDLPAAQAVLGVRTGGRGEEERIVAVSDPFEIVAAGREDPPPLGSALASRETAVGPSAGPAADLEQLPVPSPPANAPPALLPPPAAVLARESGGAGSPGPAFLPRRE